jgi:hypothetical protein
VTIRKPPRFNGDGTRAQLLENGLHAGTLVATDDDYKTMAGYRTSGRSWRRYPTTTAPGARIHWWGGQRTGKNSCSDEVSVFASAKMIRQTGDPMRAVKCVYSGDAGRRYSGRRLPAARAQASNIRSAARRAREEEDDVNPRPINQPRTDDGVDAALLPLLPQTSASTINVPGSEHPSCYKPSKGYREQRFTDNIRATLRSSFLSSRMGPDLKMSLAIWARSSGR